MVAGVEVNSRRSGRLSLCGKGGFGIAGHFGVTDAEGLWILSVPYVLESGKLF